MEKITDEPEQKQKLLSEYDDSEASFEAPQPHSKRRSISYIKLLAITSTFLLSTILIIEISRSLLHTNSELKWVSCGNSSAEARKNGCHYEHMQRAWIPDACYFSEPSEDYHPFVDRIWFSDEALTKPLNNTELQWLREGDDLVAYTWSFHDEHCLYCWRKLAIAVERRLPMIDSKTADFHHSTHCASGLIDFIYNVAEDKWVNHKEYTYSPLMFQTCVPLRWE